MAYAVDTTITSPNPFFLDTQPTPVAKVSYPTTLAAKVDPDWEVLESRQVANQPISNQSTLPTFRWFLTTRDRCCEFKNIFAQTFGENIGVFYSNYC
jgi:hypothetical protein